MAVGPLVGGVLVDAIGWEAIFFVNLPIGVAAIALTLAMVDESRNPAGGAIDWAGTVTFSGALFGLIFGLIRGNVEGWGSPLILVMLIGFVVLLIAFVVIEMRVAHPMLDLSLFRKPSFDGASIAAFVLSAAMFAMFLYLTLYIQNILGYSPLEAGLRFLPITLLSFVVAPISGKLAERLGIRWFLGGGLLLVAVGLLLMRGLQPGDDWTALLAGMLVCGIGIGATNPALATAAIGVVPPAAGRDGLGHQLDVPPGRDRHRHRRLRRACSRTSWPASSSTPCPRRRASAAVSGCLTSSRSAAAGHVGDPRVARAGEAAFTGALNDLLLLGAIVAFVGAVLVDRADAPGRLRAARRAGGRAAPPSRRRGLDQRPAARGPPGRENPPARRLQDATAGGVPHGSRRTVHPSPRAAR